MNTSTPRVRRVTMKNGGASVRVVYPAPPQAAGIADRLRAVGGEMADMLVNHAGFAIVAWQADGEFSFAYRNGKSSPYARAALPSIVSDMMRSHITTDLTLERSRQ